jgi:hypothetical protein
MKKMMSLVLAFILAVAMLPAYAAEVQNPNATLEEKVAVLKSINGGNYSASSEPMTMTELMDMLINAYKLDEQYVKTIGDGDADDPASYDNAFFDFGGGGDPNMPFMRGNLAYVITKLYGLSSIQIDNPESWQHMGQTGYSEIDGAERGYPGNKEAVYICQQLGIDIPQVSDTELGFETLVTKAEFAIACYSAIGKEPFSFVPPVEIKTETVSNDYYTLTNVVRVLEQWDGQRQPPAGEVRPVNGGTTYVVAEGAKLTNIVRLFRYDVDTHTDITWDIDAIKYGDMLNSENHDGQQLNVASIDLAVNTRYRFDVEYDYGWDTVWEYTVEIIVVDSATAAQIQKPVASTTTATPTNTTFILNDEQVSLPAYLIDENNYVKLRDVAALLETRFEVLWQDGKAKLYNHKPYTVIGGELVDVGTDSQTATPSTTAFVWGESDEAVTGLTAYLIAENNYIKLRDIAKLFDFDVDWRDGKAWIEPDMSPYTED